ncbi:MAG: sugar phosphate nucleotidyltransferase [Oscillospiraceae bacterium]
MSEPTLVVLAAGMGSRYGGLKQIDPMGPNGELIIDYSIHDAMCAGFKKVVFLIREFMREDFEEVIGRRVSQKMETAYVYQELNKFLPEGFEIPEGRTKPWGTAQALLCCSEVISGPFAMINSDDYYGPDAFRQIYSSLKNADVNADPMEFSMVGYLLGNTVTESGKVARGLCQTENGMLKNVVERTYVVKTPTGPAYSLDNGATFTQVPGDSIVSMNFWGFTPALFEELSRRFPLFLATELEANPNEEMFIPNVVGQLLREGKCTVKVMESADKWYGVTYREDKPTVQQAIQSLITQGVYPKELWD